MNYTSCIPNQTIFNILVNSIFLINNLFVDYHITILIIMCFLYTAYFFFITFLILFFMNSYFFMIFISPFFLFDTTILHTFTSIFLIGGSEIKIQHSLYHSTFRTQFHHLLFGDLIIRFFVIQTIFEKILHNL